MLKSFPLFKFCEMFSETSSPLTQCEPRAPSWTEHDCQRENRGNEVSRTPNPSSACSNAITKFDNLLSQKSLQELTQQTRKSFTENSNFGGKTFGPTKTQWGSFALAHTDKASLQEFSRMTCKRLSAVCRGRQIRLSREPWVLAALGTPDCRRAP